MFGRGKETRREPMSGAAVDRVLRAAEPPKRPGPRVQHSIISPDLEITGDVFTSGDLTVEGAVNGSITCRTLTLGGAPSIKGDVKAETVRVCGVFSGNIAAGQVHLVKSAVMTGDIAYRTLTIDRGASFEGRLTPAGARS